MSNWEESHDLSLSLIECQASPEPKSDSRCVASSSGESDDEETAAVDENDKGDESVPSKVLNQKLSILVENQKNTNKLLTNICSEVTKSRKLLSKFVTAKYGTKSTCTEGSSNSICNATAEPVMHEGKDLLKEGRRNFEITHYALHTLHIARTLWTDEELTKKRLLPKSHSVTPLSPNRTDKFVTSVKRRFSLESNEEMEPVLRPVNQPPAAL